MKNAERGMVGRPLRPALFFSWKEGSMEQHIFGVTEVNHLVKLLLDQEPMLNNVAVRGELSNYKMYPSGHHYFTLKDQEGALRCVMFKGAAVKLRFRPENGMKVIVQGRITVFPRDGAYQLYCNTMTPEGVGDLAVAFEQLKVKLQNEGYFDSEHKKPLPEYPERIALITSSAGAAVHDMIRILRRRYPIAKVILLPVRVQGAEAPLEIAGAIRYANRWKVADLIITGRGGGSIEDLWAFNDERVAKAIYDSELPIISAVGHEPDVTISDYVADVRASTPSNAAELAVPDKEELLRWLRDIKCDMEQGQLDQFTALRERLQALAAKRVMTNQLAYVQDRRMEVVHAQQRLGDLSGILLGHKRQKFSMLAASLDAMSPLKVLGRGYAIAQKKDGEIIKRYQDIAAGDPVTVILGEGGFTATVDDPLEEVHK